MINLEVETWLFIIALVASGVCIFAYVFWYLIDEFYNNDCYGAVDG